MCKNGSFCHHRSGGTRPVRHFALFFEGVVALCQVAERNHDACGNNFGNCWVKPKLLHKEFDEDIIEENAGHHQK